MTRRQFLALTAGAGLASGSVASLLVSCSPATESGPPIERNPLRMPTTSTGGILTATYGSASIWPGATTSALLLNGSYLGPTFIANRGDQFSLSFINQLGEASNVHWHGLNVPANMDGHPADAIDSGAFQYTFPIQQRAGTYWYHAHPDMLTAKQAYSGFAGCFIVRDGEEQGLDLPRGAYDIPFVLQDKKTSGTTLLPYAPTPGELVSGVLGNEVFVNGTPYAYLDVEQATYRFRILNGSNARVYKIGFSDGRTFHVIGTDGGLLDKPYLVQDVMLSPGERVEVLVTFRNTPLNSSIMMQSLPFGGGGHAGHGGGGTVQGAALPILMFNVKKASDQQYTMPASLAALERLDASAAARTRPFVLTMDHSLSRGMHQINGKTFEMNVSDYRIPFGETEIWEIRNEAEGLHSMHVHGTQFQVLDRNGLPTTAPVDFGWKDTVLVRDFEVVRILLRFSDYRGRYLFHCHFLEHEDDGMMVNIDVV